jgi:hypothetical protein
LEFACRAGETIDGNGSKIHDPMNVCEWSIFLPFRQQSI